jgi:hypothetical protein
MSTKKLKYKQKQWCFIANKTVEEPDRNTNNKSTSHRILKGKGSVQTIQDNYT